MDSAFSIITPSFNQIPWLRRCARSIADQEEVEIQHVIQDAGSDEIDSFDPGNLATSSYRPELYIEADSGMYDAVNRGFRRQKHELSAYLNCDEQYLPGALKAVAEEFAKRPDLDVLFGDVLVLSETDEPLCYRKAILPRAHVIRASHLPSYTCSTFFRASIVERFPFHSELKAVADAYWMLEMLEAGVQMATMGFATSVFYYTGANVSESEDAQQERSTLRNSIASWKRPLVKAAHRVEKMMNGSYRPPAGSYRVVDRKGGRITILDKSPSGVMRKTIS